MNTIMFRYIFSHLTKVITGITLVIMTLFAVLSLIENLGKNLLGGLFGNLRDIMLKLPEIAYLTLPATCAIGTAVGLAMLDGRGEFALLRGMGVSKTRVIRWLAVSSTVWIVLHAAVGEFLLTKSAAVIRNLESQRSGSFIASGEDIWLRTPSGFVRIDLLAADGRTVHNVWLFTAPDDAKLTQVAQARKASWLGGNWRLEEVQVARLAEDGNWRFSNQENIQWIDAPTPELLESLAVAPIHLPLGRLLEITEALEEIGQNTRPYELVIWGRLIDSIAILLLMISGMLVVANRPRNSKSQVKSIGVAALMVMMIYYYSSVIIRQAALDGNWPAFVGASLPPALFAAVAGAALLWQRRSS